MDGGGFPIGIKRQVPQVPVLFLSPLGPPPGKSPAPCGAPVSQPGVFLNPPCPAAVYDPPVDLAPHLPHDTCSLNIDLSKCNNLVFFLLPPEPAGEFVVFCCQDTVGS